MIEDWLNWGLFMQWKSLDVKNIKEKLYGQTCKTHC